MTLGCHPPKGQASFADAVLCENCLLSEDTMEIINGTKHMNTVITYPFSKIQLVCFTK